MEFAFNDTYSIGKGIMHGVTTVVYSTCV